MPKESRTWVRCSQTGQRAYLVQRNGKNMVRLDRPEEELVYPYDSSRWIPEKDGPKYNRAQAAMVAYAADRVLLRFDGKMQESRREWESQTEAERFRFIQNGPLDPYRKTIYDLIVGELIDESGPKRQTEPDRPDTERADHMGKSGGKAAPGSLPFDSPKDSN